MNGLSSYVINSITDNNQRADYRRSQRKRLAKGAEFPPKKNYAEFLKTLAIHMHYGPHLPEEVEQVEEASIQPETVELTPDEVRRQEAKHLAYQRMIHNSVLVEAEYAAQKLRNGR